jgi:hypothetical protein
MKKGILKKDGVTWLPSDEELGERDKKMRKLEETEQLNFFWEMERKKEGKEKDGVARLSSDAEQGREIERQEKGKGEGWSSPAPSGKDQGEGDGK